LRTALARCAIAVLDFTYKEERQRETEMTLRMIIKTDTVDADGRASNTTERVRHIPADQVDAYREAARQSAPRGAVRTIKVVSEN
jgi:hypothetical protein